MAESRKRAVIETATLNFPSISAGAVEELTVASVDASAGGIVALGQPAGFPAGLIATGFIDDTDAIVVRVHNTTGAAIDPGSAAGVASQGTLTLDTQPTGEVASQGTLTIAEPVTDTDTFTIDAKVYTLQTALTNVDGNIAIGGSEAQTKLNIIAALDLSGVAGTDYAALMTAHPTVDGAAFIVDDAVLTAKTPGVAGDSIATTETFTHVSNVFDAATLGTTTAGVDSDTYTIGAKTYKFQDTLTNVDGNVDIGGTLAQAKLNLVAAIDLSGVAGTDYATAMTAHGVVSVAAFIADDAIVTAVTAGRAGNALATTETFAAGTNIFDAATLGTTTLGQDASEGTWTIGLIL